MSSDRNGHDPLPPSESPRRTPRQEELLDVALDLAREVGLGGLTVRALADRVGFTEAALYRHYPSKRALLVALMRRIEERFLPTFRKIAAARDRPVRERLIDVMEHHVSAVLAIDGMPIFMLSEAAATDDRELQDQISGTMGHYMALLDGLLGELPADARGGRTPRELTLILVGLSAATALHHRLFPDEALERVAADELPAFVVSRLFGDPTPTP